MGEQKVPSLQALKTVWNTFEKIEGLGAKYLVINRYDPSLEDFTVKHLQETLQLPRMHTVANEWHAFKAAMNGGQVLRQEAPRCRALADIDALAALLLGVTPKKRSHWHIPAFLRRLVHTTANDQN